MISLFLFFSLIHLSVGLKPTDLCIIRQECKGFYDNQHKYQIKCESIKCHGTFNNDCGFNICSRSKNKCTDLLPHPKL